MEYSLRRIGDGDKERKSFVLILILMEYSLRRLKQRDIAL